VSRVKLRAMMTERRSSRAQWTDDAVRCPECRREVDEFTDLGSLKGNKGNQQYELPQEVDLGRPHTVVIWCRAFSVNFARAPLS